MEAQAATSLFERNEADALCGHTLVSNRDLMVRSPVSAIPFSPVSPTICLARFKLACGHRPDHLKPTPSRKGVCGPWSPAGTKKLEPPLAGLGSGSVDLCQAMSQSMRFWGHQWGLQRDLPWFTKCQARMIRLSVSSGEPLISLRPSAWPFVILSPTGPSQQRPAWHGWPDSTAGGPFVSRKISAWVPGLEQELGSEPRREAQPQPRRLRMLAPIQCQKHRPPPFRS